MSFVHGYVPQWCENILVKFIILLYSYVLTSQLPSCITDVLHKSWHNNTTVKSVWGEKTRPTINWDKLFVHLLLIYVPSFCQWVNHVIQMGNARLPHGLLEQYSTNIWRIFLSRKASLQMDKVFHFQLPSILGHFDFWMLELLSLYCSLSWQVLFANVKCFTQT